MKNIGIIGAGITGVESAVNARKLGYNVFLSEKKEEKTIDKKQREQFHKNNIKIEVGKNTLKFFKDCSEIILSPGIPLITDIVKELQKSGRKIISDIDFAYRNIKGGKWIAITGTNGKTTTTRLLGDILEKKYRTFVGGNIGASPTNGISKDYEVFCLEMSSFQIDLSSEVEFDGAVLLNITEDHLNRYGTMKKYIRSKLRIFERTNGYKIINIDDMNINSSIGDRSNYHSISMEKHNNEGAYFNKESNIILFSINDKQYELKKNLIPLLGYHNIYNVMAAGVIGLLCNVEFAKIQEAIKNFTPLPYRIEFVKIIGNIRIYNDSKSTTPESTRAAIESFARKTVILIIGGSDEKKSDFTILNDSIEKYCKFILTIGEAAGHITDELNSDKVIGQFTIEKALDIALEKGMDGDTILFSPGCPSFDRFKNYKERGRFFGEIVHAKNR